MPPYARLHPLRRLILPRGLLVFVLRPDRTILKKPASCHCRNPPSPILKLLAHRYLDQPPETSHSNPRDVPVAVATTFPTWNYFIAVPNSLLSQSRNHHRALKLHYPAVSHHPIPCGVVSLLVLQICPRRASPSQQVQPPACVVASRIDRLGMDGACCMKNG